VLVVDDGPAARALITQILTGAGYRILAAASAEEALRLVEQEEVGMVLTEIDLPGSLSGFELFDALQELRPRLPIMLLTGSIDQSNLREALDRGAAGFITKPFTADGLVWRVASALNRLLLADVDLRERLLAPAVASVLANAVVPRDQGLEDHTERLTTVASVLANAVELRDPSMEGHADRLASLALEIGRRSGVLEPDLGALEIGAVLHDVGKIGIPDSILLKPGAITARERTVMQTHTTIGDLMLAPLSLLEPVREVVRHHHERWDGNGYPDRWAGEAIPPLARIVALADSIEAMSGDRLYRPPLGKEDVVHELRAGSGGQWEPALVDIALDLIDSGQLRFEAGGLNLLSA
jgi:response regulator RpfG family c-di-GMP phosphodiesterase